MSIGGMDKFGIKKYQLMKMIYKQNKWKMCEKCLLWIQIA